MKYSFEPSVEIAQNQLRIASFCVVGIHLVLKKVWGLCEQ